MQMKAIRAILEPNFEKARPTPYWAGLGFSKSVSEPMMKEKMSIGALFSSNLADERRISYSNEGALHDLTASLQSYSIDQPSGSKIFTDPNNNMNMLGMPNSKNNNSNNNNHNNNNIGNSPSSNMSGAMINQSSNSNAGMISGSPNLTNNQKISSCLKLAMFLGRIALVQYLGLFTQHNIDLEALFTLNENDFAELGIPYVHRRKLAIAIAEVKSSIQNERSAYSSLSSTFDAAPGAERSKRQKARCSIQGELSDIWST